jgi:hypothetical protein
MIKAHRVLWLLMFPTAAALSNCSDSEDPPGSRAAAGDGSAGDALGGATLTGGSTGGDSVAGASGEGGAPGAGGVPSGEESTCEAEYELASYSGDTEGLCQPAESVWRNCCSPDGDIAAAERTRCAPDGSVCIVGSYCTLYGGECGWSMCDPNEVGAAGAGGAEQTPCQNPEAILPCSTDAHCIDGLVCNRRVSNRMFCGEPEL